jgi:hypothetical protein
MPYKIKKIVFSEGTSNKVIFWWVLKGTLTMNFPSDFGLYQQRTQPPRLAGDSWIRLLFFFKTMHRLTYVLKFLLLFKDAPDILKRYKYHVLWLATDISTKRQTKKTAEVNISANLKNIGGITHLRKTNTFYFPSMRFVWGMNEHRRNHTCKIGNNSRGMHV